ncbi:uncharacterized protein MAM_04730 [Metarhizium album ARSEF 1941]|uniref:Nascent polypeptide-associated complex subunit alpha-like UBA domain-containing protein n=1 Tax=Metarhizium album (strain ARSEF 1941) TaxID=1081103 RepID=A0A0B2WXY5_METAS|nr:uncharacterized protein MAM_04730 [Metarhizium album ARSEF 1941]KHN97715.1 hypothetical protein MAM_04730 [Metarhizium album ARSEF 1941]
MSLASRQSAWISHANPTFSARRRQHAPESITHQGNKGKQYQPVATKMAEPQPRNIHEGATIADVEEELQSTAKSAEDRKAASALASLDAAGNDDAAGRDVDQEAVNKAMKSLGGAKSAPATASALAKSVKVDAADLGLLMHELELSKQKATELLKAHDGDALKAMRAWIKA